MLPLGGQSRYIDRADQEIRMPDFHRINLGITKCYLLKCLDGYLLIDTGYPTDFGKFVKALAQLDVELSQITYLLLTHHHDDHVGFATRLVKQTGCKIIVHKHAVIPLGRGESEDTMEPVNRCIGLVFSLFRIIHKEFKYPPVNIGSDDVIISGDDNYLLKKIGVDGEIIHTPGHSKDSIAVILTDGSAFVGDAAMNFLNFCGIKYRPIFIEDEEKVFQSWEKLTEHGAERIYPAHGNPFSAEELNRYRKKFTGK
jgi:hydroxyacylglutathione hydrolase